MTTPLIKRLPAHLQAHFNDAYGLFPVPVTVTDEQRRFVWVNEACCRFYQRTREELLGETAACLLQPAALVRQGSKIAGFNQRLGTEGFSVQRFINDVAGHDQGVLVIAFERKIRGRAFRVGVAIPESFTSFAPTLCDQVVRGRFDLPAFLALARRQPQQLRLLQELARGQTLKECTASRTEKASRKALDRLARQGRKFCDRPVSSATLRSLALVLAAQLLEA